MGYRINTRNFECGSDGAAHGARSWSKFLSRHGWEDATREELVAKFGMDKDAMKVINKRFPLPKLAINGDQVILGGTVIGYIDSSGRGNWMIEQASEVGEHCEVYSGSKREAAARLKELYEQCN